MHFAHPRSLLAAALLTVASAAAAAPTSHPANDVPAATTLPANWRVSGDDVTEYRMSRSASAHHDGQYGAAIEHVSGSGNGFGTLVQAIRAEPYRGKRVILKGWMKTDDAGAGQMWLRIDGTDRTLSMDNMDNRPVTGTTGWKQYTIVMDIPVSADKLAFGVFLAGKGSLAFDDLTFEIAPEDAKPTRFYDFMKDPFEGPFKQACCALDAPANLDFEH